MTLTPKPTRLIYVLAMHRYAQLKAIEAALAVATSDA